MTRPAQASAHPEKSALAFGTVATGPRFALLQDELRDAGQRELAAILKLLLAKPLQLFEELPRVGALEADVDSSEMLDEMRE